MKRGLFLGYNRCAGNGRSPACSNADSHESHIVTFRQAGWLGPQGPGRQEAGCGRRSHGLSRSFLSGLEVSCALSTLGAGAEGELSSCRHPPCFLSLTQKSNKEAQEEKPPAFDLVNSIPFVAEPEPGRQLRPRLEFILRTKETSVRKQRPTSTGRQVQRAVQRHAGGCSKQFTERERGSMSSALGAHLAFFPF